MVGICQKLTLLVLAASATLKATMVPSAHRLRTCRAVQPTTRATSWQESVCRFGKATAESSGLSGSAYGGWAGAAGGMALEIYSLSGN